MSEHTPQFQKHCLIWVERPQGVWRAFWDGRLELLVRERVDGFVVQSADSNLVHRFKLRDEPFSSLNLAKRASSRWLREQAGERTQHEGRKS